MPDLNRSTHSFSWVDGAAKNPRRRSVYRVSPGRGRLQFTVTQRRMKKLSGRWVRLTVSRVPQTSGWT